MTLSDGRDTDAHLRTDRPAQAASEFVQLLDPDGTRVTAPGYDQWIADLDDAALLALYRDMVVIHRVDAEATALQRQGEIGLWPPLAGQEAAQVGSAHALRDDDFVFSSYREHAVAWCRGLRPEDLLKVWRGVAGSGWDPYELGMATPQIIIAAQTLHAVGYAMGIQRDGTDQAAIAYFGDGATSEGDASEALVFAATYKAPVVFFCQNNQWAISEPVGLQSTQHLAQRAAGFGIPWMRVDGNDVLAVMAATRIALERARTGGGPTYIEAVTYRMGPHTTADDPKRYRTDEELESWRGRDPIARLEALLRSRGALDDDGASDLAREADAAAAAVRAACVSLPDPEPLSIFDHVYAEPNSHVQRQRDHYARYLAMFDEPGPGGEGARA
ncbi:pyruvate dehydrogenase E1 component alpha subunit [Agromyces rhizosphaerae]|uniref:Pyruvate dehydrogenase E1 component alpha subunit n=1 Tax=Agromyces rhizosphaerae TaxID=88374 RepID=A0A9W6CNX5_9MICO|nr:pyruvate dehydrogenase (acetyl-transferring) E1 component subunit alpha [Agromyces rhizosphaerae]GLI25843.1 pyruvate dehydrogenase E1 component alpha subunit [Agromyces rhizosphaerae]